MAIGTGAISHNVGDVALGAGSVTAAAVATTGATIGGNPHAFAGTAPTSTVSVGDVGAERTITNVAAGRLSDTSTDAVNGSQLKATNDQVDINTTNITNTPPILMG
ncbi:Haemagglutinin [Serratia fonticola]|uniref:Haemagglutinin n=1 Tax=Serratia fonticola TaxID=47917 RepID=A0A4U9W283_SERFO|nr:Haemagglutinin [Serratia fonticola]